MNAKAPGAVQVEVTADTVRVSLNRLDSYELLGPVPLSHTEMVEERLEQIGYKSVRTSDRGYALASIIHEALEAVFPSVTEGEDASRSITPEMGRSLRLRYIERLSRAEAATALKHPCSLAVYDRLHRRAVERLSAELRRRNDDARRRRSRQNSIEQMIKPIRVLYQQRRFEDVLVAGQKVFAVLYDAGLWEDYQEISELAVAAAQDSGQEALAMEIRVANIARLNVDLRRMDEAEGVALVALSVAERKGMLRVQGEAYRILGIVKRERKDLSGSMADLKKSQTAFLKSGDPVRAVQIAGILAVDLRRDRRWSEAMQMLRDQLDCYAQFDDPRERPKGESITICRLGTLYYERALFGCDGDAQARSKDLGEARACYLQALDMEHQLGRPRSIAFNAKKLALVEIESGNLAEARRQLEDAKRFFEGRGYPHEAAEIQEIEERLAKLENGEEKAR